MPAAPAELQRIVRKCLAKDPEDRYQSMKEVAIDLRDLRRQLDSGAIVAPAAAAATRPRMNRALVLAAGAVALAAVVSAAVYLSRRDTAAPPHDLQLSRVTQSGNVIDAAISPDGKYFAYVESQGGRQSLWYRQMSGTRALELVPPAPQGYWGVTFSRDATSIYYAIKSATEPLGALFEIPVLGGTPRRVLGGIDSKPGLSPDGSRLVYLRAGYPQDTISAVMVAAADGTGARALATVRAPDLFAPGFFASPSWSPDGTRIAATTRNGQKREAHLVLIDPASGAVTSMPGVYASANFAEWLPDGTGIVFSGTLKDGGVPTPGGQLLLQPYPSGAVRRITNDLVDYRTGHVTADGRSILAVGFDATLNLWTAPLANPSAIQKLPSLISDGRFGVAWSGDGQRIYFGGSSRDLRQISSIARDGSDRREFAHDNHASWPALSPDGSFIVFFGSHGGQFGVWRARLDGTDVRPLAPVSDAAYQNISPDGRWLYYTSAVTGVLSTWRVPTDGSAPPALVAAGLERAAVSPDGRMLAGIYSPVANGPQSLGILPSAGGAPVNVFPGMAAATGAGNFVWGLDGKSVLYTTVERSNIWRQRLSGGAPEKVTSYSDLTIFRFDLSRDGQLALARGTQTRDAVLISNFR